MDVLDYINLYVKAVELRRKEDEDFQIEAELMQDLIDSMNGCCETLHKAIPQLENLVENQDPNDLVSLSREQLEMIRDFSGNLSLLSNMILNGKQYSDEDKKEAIFDETTD